MPAKSQAQRKWAFGVKGAKWAKAHHFDNAGPLPKRVKAVKKAKPKKAKRKLPKRGQRTAKNRRKGY
jgi:hypothetical protein